MDALRHIKIGGYTLQTWDTGRRTDGIDRPWIAYEFKSPDGVTIFKGDDFGASPQYAVDSDQSLRSLLTFLTLKPGDTDREYFESYYTPEQLAFAEGDAEQLQALLSEQLVFEDLDQDSD